MTDLQADIADNRAAVKAFLSTARAVAPSQWEAPRAPGRWSPRQVTEHVALAYELSRAVLQHSFPGRAAPRLLRPIIRTLFLNPVLKSGRFGKGGKSPGPFQPSATPALLEPLTARLQAASDAFETDLSAAATSADATVDHPFFGRIPLTEYLRFQAIHTRHHQQQLSPVAV